MPGSVANASPSTVMPVSLFTLYERDFTFPLRTNVYTEGEFQASVQATTSRKIWKVAKRLPPSVLNTLYAFYLARRGNTEPFYFYDPYETSPKFTSDPTGVATTGRYTVRFDTDWVQGTGPARSEVSLSLIELA